MITPFTADGRVDYEALGRMIDYVIEGRGRLYRRTRHDGRDADALTFRSAPSWPCSLPIRSATACRW